ncbi:MAG: T9SS type A sorting domain-containing protein [Saprospiraceae bacterium]|nr:T9SS type A sorting domain-containing protein [Saprospiraceae bacterium]
MFTKFHLKALLIVMLFSNSVNSQISGVNYQVKFNEQTNLFDCYLIIKEGSAKSMRERVQFNAQYTMVVPAGSTVEMAKSYMPLQNNQNYSGDTPLTWTVANSSLGPDADQFNDYVSIIPTLSPAAFYNDLKKGDAVKLFSLNILPITDCGDNIKLFENGLDPDSQARGMMGGDFSNGFTVGGIQQKYRGNEAIETPELDIIKGISNKTIKNNLELNVDLKDNVKYGPFSYEWNGPNGYKSYNKDVKLKNVTQDNFGTYTLDITDSRGCKQTKNIETQITKLQIGSIEVTKSVDQSNSRISVENSVNIFPNPAITSFNISITGGNGASVIADLMDVNGGAITKNIYKTTIQNNRAEGVVSLQNVLPGLYTLTVSIDGDISTHKLIVVK